MAPRKKKIETPGDVAPAEVTAASPAAEAAAQLMAEPDNADNAEYVEINGERRKVIDRSAGWMCVDGIGWIASGIR